MSGSLDDSERLEEKDQPENQSDLVKSGCPRRIPKRGLTPDPTQNRRNDGWSWIKQSDPDAPDENRGNKCQDCRCRVEDERGLAEDQEIERREVGLDAAIALSPVEGVGVAVDDLMRDETCSGLVRIQGGVPQNPQPEQQSDQEHCAAHDREDVPARRAGATERY